MLAASASLAGLTLMGPEAEAADRFALTCMQNKTNLTLNYKTKWGDGQWQTHRIVPGGKRWHAWEYQRGQEGRSPWLHVAFDDDLSGRAKHRTYRLASYASPQQGNCQRYGKQHQFRYDGTAKKYIDLVVVD